MLIGVNKTKLIQFQRNLVLGLSNRLTVFIKG